MRPDGVDVPLHEVSAEPAVGAQRALEVHERARARARRASSRAASRARRRRESRPRRACDDRQADAVDRQAVAGRQLGGQRRAMRSRTPPLVGLRSTTSPTASTRPVNISLRSARPARAARRAARRASAVENRRPVEKRHAPGAEHVRRDVQPHVVDDALVPRRRVQRAPPSSSSELMPRSPRHVERRARTCRRAATSISAPRASSALRSSCALDAAGAVVTMMTGPASRVESTRAPGGVRSSRSKTTRVSGRSRYDAAGRQQRIVGQDRPDADADGVDLGADAAARAGSPPRTSARVRRPALAAMQPSRLIAAFRIDERPALRASA